MGKILRKEQQKTVPSPERQAEILERCDKDIWYFVNHFCWTYDPREADPELPFDLFARQEEFLAWLEGLQEAQDNGLAEKCRDVGFTWLTSVFALHRWLFRKGSAIGFGSRKLDLVDKIGDPKCIFDKIRFLLYRLPTWFLKRQAKGFTRRRHDGHCKLLNPHLGSSITGEGGDNIGRGGRTSMYFVDEAAFLEHPELVDAALSMNTRCRIDVSTPNGMGNSFYRRRHGGKVSVFTFRWQDDPRKDDAWYQKQVNLLDPVIVAQEINIDYAASIEGICIPAKYVQAAIGLLLPPSGPILAGLDVAGEGKNKNVFITRRGPLVGEIEDWAGGETTETAHKAADVADRLGVTLLSYDCVGIGAGVKGTFNTSERKFRFKTNAVSGGDPPSDSIWPDGRTSKQRFLNQRAELWWGMRMRFERAYEYKVLGVNHPAEDMISIPNHSELISQLSMPLCFTMESGKTKIESKPDMRARGVASPDYADALSYSFAKPKEPESKTIPVRPTVSGFSRR